MHSILIQNIQSNELKKLVFEAVTLALKENGLPHSQLEPSLPKTPGGLLTKKEAATYLKVSLPTLSKYVKSGYVKAHTVAGTRLRFKIEELDRAVKGLKNR